MKKEHRIVGLCYDDYAPTSDRNWIFEWWVPIYLVKKKLGFRLLLR